MPRYFATFDSRGVTPSKGGSLNSGMLYLRVRNFSPRMNYNSNEWRPVGRGDPLKNDPTFDYSPPTLDRVRYWADPDKDNDVVDEVAANIIDAKLKKANPGKNEILLLGVTGDRAKGGTSPLVHQPHAQHMMKNAKGETPLLQPKYTSVRRSYYAHQLPTHLMPPPMQPAMAMMPTQQQQQQHQMPQQSQVGHMMKPAHTEYRHNMPIMSAHHSYMSSSSMAPVMNAGHSKPYHMTSTSSQPWMHSPSPASSHMVTSMPALQMKPAGMSQHGPHHFVHTQSHAHPDAHHQESMNYLTYTRPSMTNSQHSMGAGHDYYSPNSIRGSSGLHKSSTSSRKPWIHDLLQKEFIKTMKPTTAPSSMYHHSESPVKSPPHMESHFEPMLSSNKFMQHSSSSSTYSPVTFVTATTISIPKTPTITTTTQAPVFVTASSSSTSTSTTYHTTSAPIFFTHATTTQAPRTTTTLSPTRLLIPNTSNLSYRPTVAPFKMTTDSLFSHYNQPEKPLRGPMYLIIEGHSKVKTYGKDELDPHKPKIVPVISSREPVVRRADPNEKRGTPETFQVKHLHTKTTQAMEKATESTPKMTTSLTTKKPVVTTTTKPMSTTAKTTTLKPKTMPTKAAGATTKKMETTTVSNAKKSETTTTAKTVPKLSVTFKPTLTTTTATTLKPKLEKNSSKDEKIPSKTALKGEKTGPNNLNSLSTAEKPTQISLTEPPTGMQGLLSLLDSSLNSFLKEDKSELGVASKETTTGTTKLKSISMPEARVSTKLQAIKADDYYDDISDAQYLKTTTEYLPRETRQIFDYDQLPESRVTSDKEYKNYEEEDLSAFGFDDEYEEDEEEDPNNHQLLKRIDALVSSPEDLDDLETDSMADFAQANLEGLDLARRQQKANIA
uniref:Uncharacterized protein n=1 Tax=Stomoxys calcitrans TaxID=35570 RepID=A0A1I8NRK9_STOCA